MLEPSFTCGHLLTNEFEKDCSYGKASPDYSLCVGGQPFEFYKNMSRLFDVNQTGNKIRFTLTPGAMPVHHEGHYLTATDHERRNNTMYFYKCKNIVMQNIDLYTSPSFGVLSLLCENITVQCVNSITKPGTDRKMAVVADMFHFVNTNGNIQIKDSTVYNLKDDCINVHSIYTRVVKKLSSNKILIDCPYIAKKIFNLYRPGDRIKTVNTTDFTRSENFYTVKNSVFCGRYHLEVEFEENISEIQEGIFLTAFEYEPSLHIDGCKFGHNRGRCVLVQTAGDVIIIENNTFYASEVAILLGGCSTTYMEGSPAQSLTIRKNLFDGLADLIEVAGSVTTDKIIYGKIIAQENTFKVHPDRLIANLKCFDTVSFKDNIVEGCKNNASLYNILNCTNVFMK